MEQPTSQIPIQPIIAFPPTHEPHGPMASVSNRSPKTQVRDSFLFSSDGDDSVSSPPSDKTVVPPIPSLIAMDSDFAEGTVCTIAQKGDTKKIISSKWAHCITSNNNNNSRSNTVNNDSRSESTSSSSSSSSSTSIEQGQQQKHKNNKNGKNLKTESPIKSKISPKTRSKRKRKRLIKNKSASLKSKQAHWNPIKSEDNWSPKALLILDEITQNKKSQPFQERVCEKKHGAPNYYKIITQPMDLKRLRRLCTSRAEKPNRIYTARDFISKLMLIWDNAQRYNSSPKHWLHQRAIMFREISTRLVNQYFPEYTLQSPSPNHLKPITTPTGSNQGSGANTVNSSSPKYHQIRGLLCGVCDERLHFTVGYPSDLSLSGMLYCTHCSRPLTDLPHNPYYQCIHGRKQEDKSKQHTAFVCCDCAEGRYNARQLMISELPNHLRDSRDIAFRGLFVHEDRSEGELLYEAIVLQQNGNLVSYELVMSSATDSEAYHGHVIEANIVNMQQRRIKVSGEEMTTWQDATLSADGKILTFYDFRDPNENKKFTKVIPRCECGEEMLFMDQDMMPSHNTSNQIFCDYHHKYYEKNELLPETKRCLSFKEMDPSNRITIYRQRFYFSCINNDCKSNLDMCNICTLIQKEEEFKEKENEKKLNQMNVKRTIVSCNEITSPFIVTNGNGNGNGKLEADEENEKVSDSVPVDNGAIVGISASELGPNHNGQLQVNTEVIEPPRKKRRLNESDHGVSPSMSTDTNTCSVNTDTSLVVNQVTLNEYRDRYDELQRKWENQCRENVALRAEYDRMKCDNEITIQRLEKMETEHKVIQQENTRLKNEQFAMKQELERYKKNWEDIVGRVNRSDQHIKGENDAQ